MDKIWTDMLNAAQAAINPRRVSEYVTCGEVNTIKLRKIMNKM